MTSSAGDPLANLLRGADTPVSPRPEFADELLRRLLSELASVTPMETERRGTPPGGGLLSQPAAPPPQPARLPARRAGSSLGHLATAALVLLALAASLYALGPWRFGREETPPAMTIDAPTSPIATPAATPATPVVDTAPVAFVWRAEDAEGAKLGLSPQLAVAPDGDIWVVDAARDGFQIVSPDGELRERWGAPGTGAGEFNFQRDSANAPGGIAFRADGGFYVLDAQNRRVQQFDADRAFVRAWGDFGEGDGQFVDPTNILLDDDGNVYVFDARRGDVQKFDAGGEFLLRFDLPGGEIGPSGPPGTRDTNLWVADADTGLVARFTPDGAWVQTIGQSAATGAVSSTPWSVAVDAAGRVFVADAGSGRVQVFAADGQVLWSFDGTDAGGPAFRRPLGIALDSKGSVYVLDAGDDGSDPALHKFRLPASAP